MSDWIPCDVCDTVGEIHQSGGVPSYTCTNCNGEGYIKPFSTRLNEMLKEKRKEN